MPDEISGYSYSPDLKDKIVKIFHHTTTDLSFPESHCTDLYVPGNPAHPITFINGFMDPPGL